MTDRRLVDTLRRVFGHRHLRGGQRVVIDRLLAGRSTLAVMPTGAGKSLCYQLPALLLEGRTIVVSPLIALMKDQCEKLNALGIAAVQFNSHVPAADIHAGEAMLVDGSARIVFTTPERLADAQFMALLQARPTALLAVDEAHCISQWGHDFRPAFLDIALALPGLGHPPVLALTATANADVAQDILQQLRIPASGWIDTGSYRPNLHYGVQLLASEKDKLARTLELVQAHEGCGIVYCATIKAAEAVHEALAGADESVGLYHGQRAATERREAQDGFMAGTLRVMVATNAFGMGIDKPDIRFVLHYQMPSGIDAYYQESGRAGRDGKAADCTLLYLQRDKAVQQFFMAGRYPDAKELDALYRALLAASPDDRGWTRAQLQEQLALPAGKLQAALSVLRQQRVVSKDREGRLRLVRHDLAADALQALAEGYRAKREQDRATLERMVAYAQSGQCRWQVLLADLQQSVPAERCGTCDNCRRIAQHERAAARPIVVQTAPAITPNTTADAAFETDDAVKVKRYGQGRVVAADALSVTIEFADGSRRSFRPDFVQHTARRRTGTQAAGRSSVIQAGA